MDIKHILSMVDHTLLKPETTWEQIKGICDDAMKYHTATVCIPASYVARCKAYMQDKADKVGVCTVIGFPTGYSTTETKVFEAADAVKNGADEVDMVINIGMLKAGETDYVTDEIRALKKLCGARVLKVIVETCFLTEDEIVAACHCVTDGGADFIKTSTGFGSAGAKLSEDIECFKKHIGPKVQMKAAGGIHTREEMEAFLEAGCTRLGASAAVSVLKDEL